MKLLMQNSALVVFGLLWLSTVFIIDHKIISGLILPKWLWLNLVSIPTLLFLVTGVCVQKIKMDFKRADIGVVVLVGFLLMHCIWIGISPGNLISNLGTGLILWFFVRLFITSQTRMKGVLVMLLIIIIIQCVLGLLQLYGLLNSLHNLFPITGTFHNPGPFSGYVVSGLPMALGLYLITRRKFTSNRCQKDSQQKMIKEGKSISPFIVFPTRDKIIWSSNIKVWLSRLIVWVKHMNVDTCLNNFSQIAIILLLLVIPAARSRAAWLGGMCGCLYLLWSFRHDIKIYKHIDEFTTRISVIYKKLIIAISLIFICIAFLGLYKFKQGSADGRLLMWQVSWEMIKEKPILGWGTGGFEANFGKYQAEWFRCDYGSPGQELVAGIPDAPFNELIRIGVEYGFIGILLVFLVLYFSFARKDTRSQRISTIFFGDLMVLTHYAVMLKGCLISILIFSLFSYPLDVAPIVIQVIVMLALIINMQPSNCSFKPKYIFIKQNSYNLNPIIPKLSVIVLIVFIPFLINNVSNLYQGHKHWKEAYQLYQYQIYDEAAGEYEKALVYLPFNGLLLQVYGKCLVMNKQWDEALDILESAIEFRSDPILYTALGDTYKALKKYDLAEWAYESAWDMVPHKFYPGYLLVKLYNEIGNDDKAKKVAFSLLKQDVKVQSVAIEEMKIELENILD